MGNHNVRVLRITIMLNSFVLLLFFTEVISAPVVPSVIDVMRNDTRLCNATKFLYDSEYIKHCASLPHPTTQWDYTPETLNNFLCLGVYDTAYKICQYSNRLSIPINSTTVFNSYAEKFIPTGNLILENQIEFCKHKLQGYTSLYNNTNFWESLVKRLNIPYSCVKICFDYDDKLNPLCAVLAWIKSVDEDVKKANETEMNHKPVVPNNKTFVAQLDKTTNDKAIGEVKEKLEMNTHKEQPIEKLIIDSTPVNVFSGHTKADIEKVKPDAGKLNEVEVRKKPNNTNNTLETQAHNPIPHKETKQKEEKEGNTEKPDKKQDTDDLKTTTLSENTQDHYDADNVEDDIESNAGDDPDPIPQIGTGNQNESPQEPYEQKNNLQYPNIKNEDAPHFFTYFTVISVACIAGYVGYHNKQKILAIVLEGRRSRNSRGRRRPSTANYRKLDCTLEEAVTSQCNANVTHVIY